MAIKPIRSDQTITVVWSGDPAIDIDESIRRAGVGALELGKRLGADPASWREHYTMRPGEAPTEFVIGVIPPSMLSAIEDDALLGKPEYAARTLRWECFKAALRDIRNGPIERVKVDGKWVERVPRVGDRVDPAWLEDVFSGANRECALAIGATAWAWQMMAGAELKNSSGRSSQPAETGTGAQPAQNATTTSDAAEGAASRATT